MIAIVIITLLPQGLVLSQSFSMSPFLGPRAKQTTPTGYLPMQMENAYSLTTLLNSGYNGTGKTIAIVDAYGSSSITTDMNYLDNYFHLQKNGEYRGEMVVIAKTTYTLNLRI